MKRKQRCLGAKAQQKQSQGDDQQTLPESVAGILEYLNVQDAGSEVSI